MQKPTLLNMLNMKHNVAVATSTGSCDDILVERKGNKDDNDEEIDNGANASHAFWDFPLMMFAHVHSSQSRPHECRAKPSDHGVGGAECDTTQGKRCDERLAIGLEVVDEDADTGRR